MPWHVEGHLVQDWDTGLETAERTTSLKGAGTLSREHFSGPSGTPGLSRGLPEEVT